MKTGTVTMKRILAFSIAVITSMTVLAGGAKPVLNQQPASAESQEIKENKNKISSAKSKISELEEKQAELDITSSPLVRYFRSIELPVRK